MGGVKNIWSNAKEGLKSKGTTKYSTAKTYDGKLEFLAFSSSIGMAMERTFGGFAQKIAQGGGPYQFQFIKYDAKLKHRTYLQIDG
jgi:hypothetical protein